MSDPAACPWCQKPLTASPQPKRRFCTTACRNAFHDACRRHGERAFDAGDVGLAELRALRSPPHA